MTSDAPPPIRFAIVGCGHIGRRHAEMVVRDTQCRLVALCDIRPRTGLQLEAYADVPFFQDLATMLASMADIDVVTICTPNGLHTPMTIAALDAGKHVVCEKPMGLSRAGCEAMIEAAERNQRRLFGVMQNRYSPPSRWLKQVVEERRLGELHLVQVNCYWNRDERYYRPGSWKGTADMDGGTLFTQFSHFIDMLYWLFGDITDIRARFADLSHQHLTAFEDSGLVNFRFVNGGLGTINYSTAVWDRNMESSITILGSTGSVRVGGQYMDKVEYCHIKDYEIPELPPTGPANDYGDYKGSAANHHHIIRNVVETLRGQSSMTTNAHDGLKVVDIIERIYRNK